MCGPGLEQVHHRQKIADKIPPEHELAFVIIAFSVSACIPGDGVVCPAEMVKLGVPVLLRASQTMEKHDEVSTARACDGNSRLRRKESGDDLSHQAVLSSIPVSPEPFYPRKKTERHPR